MSYFIFPTACTDTWSVWSPWSGCQTNFGVESRMRDCLDSTGGPGIGCQGLNKDIQRCNGKISLHYGCIWKWNLVFEVFRKFFEQDIHWLCHSSDHVKIENHSVGVACPSTIPPEWVKVDPPSAPPYSKYIWVLGDSTLLTWVKARDFGLSFGMDMARMETAGEISTIVTQREFSLSSQEM